jgi:hypothetical protein
MRDGIHLSNPFAPFDRAYSEFLAGCIGDGAHV